MDTSNGRGHRPFDAVRLGSLSIRATLRVARSAGQVSRRRKNSMLAFL